MKKTILLSTALLVGFGAVAQNARRINRNEAYKVNRLPKMDVSLSLDQSLAPTANNRNSVTATPPPYAKFSSQRNGFGFILSDQNPLTYNQDLNCVALFQRMTQDWPGNAYTPAVNPATSTSFSGYQVVKFTTDNGATWDSVAYYNNNANWGRYPSGQIYNPPANNTLGNAWFVGTGPCTGSASTWLSNWHASVQIPTGAMPRTVQTNDQQAFSTNQAGSVGDNTYFSSYSTTSGGTGVNQGVYSCGLKFSTSGVGTPAGIYGVALFKGVPNGMGTGFTWTQDSTFINQYTVSDGEGDLTYTGKVAFSPNGQIGYVVVCGSDASATLPAANMSMQPMVWKSTDGGATWGRVNQNYDWVTNHPEIMGNLRSTVAQNVTMPAFMDTYGGGITVDNTGKLHYVTAVTPAYSSHVDSLGYSFAYPFAYEQYRCDDHPWVFDFMTDGSGTWTTTKVTDLFTSKLGRTVANDTNAYMNIWTNAGEYFDYENRVRVARSADGTKIFYVWTDSDTNNTLAYTDGSTFLWNAYTPNDYPGVYYRGMDVSTGMLTPIHSNPGVNANSGGYFFTYPTDIVMTTGSGYTIPMTYIDSRSGTYDATTAVDVYYIDDNNISTTEFTEPAYAACSIGLKEVAGTTVSNVSQNFPNPTNGVSQVKVNLNAAQDITLNVTNSIGQLVSTQTVKGVTGENILTLDASALNSGIYFYTVLAGDSKVTRKMSVTK